MTYGERVEREERKEAAKKARHEATWTKKLSPAALALYNAKRAYGFAAIAVSDRVERAIDASPDGQFVSGVNRQAIIAMKEEMQRLETPKAKEELNRWEVAKQRSECGL